MTRLLRTYRAISGSQTVYYTNEDEVPAGVTGITLISTVQIEKGALADNTFPTPIDSWTLDGESGLTSSVDGGEISLTTGTKYFGPGPNIGTNSLYFDGSTRWSMPATASLQLTGSMSVSLFVFPGGTATGNEMILAYAAAAESDPTNALYSFRFNADNNLAIFLESGSLSTNIGFSTDTKCHPGRWHHFVYQRDENDTHFVYVNGIQVSSESVGNVTDGSSSFLNLGAWPDDTEDFTGFLYNLQIFSEPLTLKQIRQIKNNTIGT